MGTASGTGTTHLSLILGTYFNKHKHKTAIVEHNESHAFSKIEEAYEGQGKILGQPTFVIKRMTFYKAYKETLTSLKNQDYSVIIVDFGRGTSRNYPILWDMDIQLLIGYGSEWRIHEFDPFINNGLTKRVNYILNMGNRDEARWFQSKYKEKANHMFYYKDPFHWSKELDKEVVRILGL